MLTSIAQLQVFAWIAPFCGRLPRRCKPGILCLLSLSLMATAASARQVEKGPGTPANPRDDRGQIFKSLTLNASVLAGEISKARALAKTLDERASDHRLTELKRKSLYNQAKLMREVAETAVVEYEQGQFFMEQDTIQGEASLAQSDIDRGELDLKEIAVVQKALDDEQAATEYTLAMAKLNLKNRRQAAEASIQKGKFGFEAAMTKKKILNEFTKPRKIRELQASVSEAEAKEFEARATWDLAQLATKKASSEAAGAAFSKNEQKAAQLLNEAYAALDKARKLPVATPAPEFMVPVTDFMKKLEEAAELWKAEQALRVEAKFRAGS